MPMTLTRSLLTILIPGLVAIAPWLLAAALYSPVKFGLPGHPTLGNAFIFAIVAVIGTPCEGLGTVLESRWDKKLPDLAVQENWITYLAHRFEKEPVGFRYISRLVTSLYFELSMLFAVPIFFLGSLVLSWFRFPDHRLLAAFITFLLIASSIFYLRWQARNTHILLCETRRDLNARWKAS